MLLIESILLADFFFLMSTMKQQAQGYVRELREGGGGKREEEEGKGWRKGRKRKGRNSCFSSLNPNNGPVKYYWLHFTCREIKVLKVLKLPFNWLTIPLLNPLKVSNKFLIDYPIFGLWVKVKISQSCSTLCDPMDYTVYGILQAKILEWVTFPFSRGSSQPRDHTQVSCIAGGFFTSWATREAQEYWSG